MKCLSNRVEELFFLMWPLQIHSIELRHQRMDVLLIPTCGHRQRLFPFLPVIWPISQMDNLFWSKPAQIASRSGPRRTPPEHLVNIEQHPAAQFLVELLSGEFTPTSHVRSCLLYFCQFSVGSHYPVIHQSSRVQCQESDCPSTETLDPHHSPQFDFPSNAMSAGPSKRRNRAHPSACGEVFFRLRWCQGRFGPCSACPVTSSLRPHRHRQNAL